MATPIDPQTLAVTISSIAAILISILTERIPIVRKWWRETLDEKYPPEQADTIRLGVQVALTVLATFVVYYAMEFGYLPGGTPPDQTFVPAAIRALVAVFVNQGAYSLDRKFGRGRNVIKG